MPWTLSYARTAEKELEAIPDDDDHDAILGEIGKYARDERVDVRKMRGYTDRYRLRWGRWRVMVERDRQTHTMTVLGVSDRKDTYR
jgi:mRNA interferase RelE/StbE